MEETYRHKNATPHALRRRYFTRAFSTDPGAKDFSYAKTYVDAPGPRNYHQLLVAWDVFYKDEVIATVFRLEEVFELVREKLDT